jgi:hypothetical protein
VPRGPVCVCVFQGIVGQSLHLSCFRTKKHEGCRLCGIFWEPSAGFLTSVEDLCGRLGVVGGAELQLKLKLMGLSCS